MAHLLATSPIVKPGEGYAARRIFLALVRDVQGKPHEYIVQAQYFHTDGSTALGDGNYFPIFHRHPEEVRLEAWYRFKQRADNESHHPLADIDKEPERFGPHMGKLTIRTGKG